MSNLAPITFASSRTRKAKGVVGKVKIVGSFLMSLPDLFSEYQDRIDDEKRKTDTLDQLVELGFWQATELGDPTRDSGAAYRLAKRVGIVVEPGITYGSVRAYLPIGKREGLPTVSYTPLGDWVDRLDVKDAICDCALSCYKIGILKAGTHAH